MECRLWFPEELGRDDHLGVSVCSLETLGSSTEDPIGTDLGVFFFWFVFCFSCAGS